MYKRYFIITYIALKNNIVSFNDKTMITNWTFPNKKELISVLGKSNWIVNIKELNEADYNDYIG